MHHQDDAKQMPGTSNQDRTPSDIFTTPDEEQEASLISSVDSDRSIRPAPRARTSYWKSQWKANQGVVLVLVSEFFNAIMIATARLLQAGTKEKPGMSTLQILFVRFSVTLAFSTCYMWYTSVPHFPWGLKEIRGLLILRGLGGFVGVFGLYYSVIYLPLAEAVVISFITPILTAWACSVILKTSFARSQFIAGLISFIGVIMIARPPFLFGSESPAAAGDSATAQQVTTLQRLSAIALGLISDVGAACVYTVIRVIGDRAHPLISVNYYAILTTVLSFFAILWIPSVAFQLPRDLREWFLLTTLGIYGFVLQFLMTKGLQLDKTSRATNMMYSQIVFAVGLDWGVWGVLPGAWSYAGGAIVTACTIWSAMQKVDEEPVVAGKAEGDAEYGLVHDRESLELEDLASSASTSE